MLAWLIADEMVDCVDCRLTRAFDRLMAPEEADTAFFAVDQRYGSLVSSGALTNSARA